jgi:hypothetical protein
LGEADELLIAEIAGTGARVWRHHRRAAAGEKFSPKMRRIA